MVQYPAESRYARLPKALLICNEFCCRHFFRPTVSASRRRWVRFLVVFFSAGAVVRRRLASMMRPSMPASRYRINGSCTGITTATKS